MCTQNMIVYIAQNIHTGSHQSYTRFDLLEMLKNFTIPLSAAIQKVFANEFTLI